MPASRINKVGAATAGWLALRVVGRREPVVIVLDGVDTPERTTGFADELLALIERHSQRRAVSVVIGYRPAADGYLPHWSVRTLPDLKAIARPGPDPAALPDDFVPVAAREERLAALHREGQERRVSRPR